jgi:putative SOS response-associated peptidase YedK
MGFGQSACHRQPARKPVHQHQGRDTRTADDLREAFQQRRCVVPADTEVTFTIVTCAANPVIGEIHDRMPVILDEPAAEDWMNWKEEDPLSLKRLLVPAPSELRPVRVVDAYTESEHRTGCSL